jgi:hypothetical protein
MVAARGSRPIRCQHNGSTKALLNGALIPQQLRPLPIHSLSALIQKDDRMGKNKTAELAI